MKKPIAITVIIPYYHAGRFVTMAIDSILNQSFHDFELIVINDGSGDDEGWEKVKKYVDSRIRIIDHKTNRGNAVRRNEGLRRATGKYICVMDDDDISYPGRLAVQYKFLEKHKEIGCVGSQGVLINEGGNIIGHLNRPCDYQQISPFLLKDNFMIHSSVMVRRSFFKQCQLFYDEKNQYASDYGLWVKCAELFPIVNLEGILLQYGVYSHQTSTTRLSQMIKEANIIRLCQLSKFKIEFSGEQKLIYLKVIKGLLCSEQELKAGIIILNKLLRRNNQLNLYDQSHLYDLFSYMMATSQQRLIAFQKSAYQL